MPLLASKFSVEGDLDIVVIGDDTVGARGTGILVVIGIVAGAVDVGVGALTTVESVITIATDDGVVIVVADDGVVSAATVDGGDPVEGDAGEIECPDWCRRRRR